MLLSTPTVNTLRYGGSYREAASRLLFSSRKVAQTAERAKVVVVGSGRMGQIRASLLYANPRFDLCGVVDVNLEGAESLADTYNTESFSSLTEAIGKIGSSSETECGLDGVVLSTPTFTHADVIREAASNGLSVFTEKPVDETAEKIERVFEITDEAGVSLCCGFQRRFDHSYVAAAQAVEFGKIGKPVMANLFFADHPVPPKEFLLTGGNVFMDLSAHDVDYIRWVLDDEVASVYATGTSSTEELAACGVHDNATMVMKFHKGAVVTLFMSRSATYGYDQRCEIFGDQGHVAVGNEHTHTSILSNSTGIHLPKLKHSFPQRFNQAFASELDAFADTLLTDATWPISADDCIRVQKVADAARQSCDQNCEIELNYDDISHGNRLIGQDNAVTQ